MTFAGLPPTILNFSTFFVTTDPIAITAPSAILTPGHIITLSPIHTPLPITTGFFKDPFP